MGTKLGKGIDLATREGALDFFEQEKRACVELFERFGEMRPRAVILGRQTPDGVPIRDNGGRPTVGVIVVAPLTLDGGAEKDMYSAALGMAIEKTRAVGVVNAMEVWRATAKGPGVSRADFPESLADFPGREEGIWLSMEHVALEYPEILFAKIDRDEARGKATLHPFVSVAEEFGENPRGMQTTGRFADLLKRMAS